MTSVAVFADVKDADALKSKCERIAQKGVETVFLIGDCSECDLSKLTNVGCDVHYIRSKRGPAGVEEVAGVRVAWCSEIATLEDLKMEIIDKLDDEIKVHILLTDQMPRGFHRNTKDFESLAGVLSVEDLETVGSSLVADLVSSIRPKYHVVAGGAFWRAPPYSNDAFEAGFKITRLVSIAPFTNSLPKGFNKKVLAVKIDDEDPTSAEGLERTPPYVLAPTSSAGGKKRKNTTTRDTAHDEKKLKKDVRTECWFCVSTQAAQKHLIVGLGEESYIACPKGAILPEAHLLVVPLAHETSMASVSSQKTRIETARQCAKVAKFLDAQGFDVMFTERRVVMKNAAQAHAYVECLPMPRDKDVLSILQACAESTYVKLRPLKAKPSFAMDDQTFDSEKVFKQCLFFQTGMVHRTKGSEDQQYIFVHLPKTNQAFAHHVKKGKAPLQFGRMVCATALDAKEKEFWQNCVLEDSKEKEIALKVRQKLV